MFVKNKFSFLSFIIDEIIFYIFFTDWGLGRRLSEHYSPKKLLGKRKFSSGSFRLNSGGYRLGTGSSENHTIDESSANETPAKKKAATETPSPEKQSPIPHTSSATTIPQEDGQRDKKFGEASCSGMQTPKKDSPQSTKSKEPPQKSASSSNCDEEKTRSQNNQASQSSSTSNDSSERPSNGHSITCHYCSSREPRTALKTCLVCGASMCSEHLRIHLESPVFQSHPLVPAVDDVSHWRCQEHQEINRIYCRPCGLCVCTVCTVIGSHKDHACISIKEAEKELRVSMMRWERIWKYITFIRVLRLEAP